ncbi:glutamyl-prolyl-tRNA synthetase [Lycorma delicatula]|uniref:glutamyl-prolyl-tRNA synthetase n=1 Tax=Lycorma delicatula TaxID=130591 RepID=UPI003F50D812
MKLFSNSCNLASAPLIVAEIIKNDFNIEIEWGDDTKLVIPNNNGTSTTLENVASICRYLARISQAHYMLYGSNVLEQIEIDHWISYGFKLSHSFSSQEQLQESLIYLGKALSPVSYLVANRLTLADLFVWSALYDNNKFRKLDLKSRLPDSVYRWYMSILDNEIILNVLAITLKVLPSLPEKAIEESLSDRQNEQQQGSVSVRKEEGKFVELHGAEQGKVIVRFPPEASGYLHIGHAKAALLNQYYKDAFQGKLVMRFDDTNPAKEKVDFEKVILEDIKLLQLTPDFYTHTSDYFDLMLEMCEKLIKEGKAYVDDTDPELMKQQREQREESANRNNSVERNLEMWKFMVEGSEFGQKCCVRAKMDMSSANGCMRDPTIYRCKNEIHPKTGSKYKVYPTYDFACPIVDSIEGVTHCLRTMEYHDRDEQFYWFINALNLRKPYIWEYSRLNMTNTVLSKRKLTWFVDNGLVDGWDDPRLPTVRGVLRRGMTVEGLKQFIIAQGSSRSVVVMEWDKIWAFNKKVIDPLAPRFTAVDGEPGGTVLVHVEGAKIEALTVAKHPKNPDVGTKTVWTSPKVLIDYTDAEMLKEGENTTFINWGNLKINKINRKGDLIENVEASLNLEDKNFKKTLKLTWLAVDCDNSNSQLVPCIVHYYDHIISKPVLGKEEDFKDYIGHETKTVMKMLGDPELRNIKKSDIIQLQRKGFFICDSPYKSASLHTGVESPAVLIFIPDGHTKEMPTQKPSKKSVSVEKEQKQQKSSPVIEKNVSNPIQSGKIQKQEANKVSNKAVNIEVPDLNQSVIENEDANLLSIEISTQGDKIRKLKADKVDKELLANEVKVLLGLKEQYKNKTGVDWSPNKIPATIKNTDTKGTGISVTDSNEINNKIIVQGDKVRQLKAEKANKSVIDNEVKILLELKVEFKKITGQDWKPNMNKNQATESNKSDKTNLSVSELNNKITQQGDVVRKLKGNKAEKQKIDVEVKVLLQLKADYKALTGEEWKPQQQPQQQKQASVTGSGAGDVNVLSDKITQQGDKVRQLKSNKAAKSIIDDEVKTLLKLKEEYKNSTGREWNPQQKQDPQTADSAAVAVLSARISEVGEKIRKLKADGADKNIVQAEVSELLKLKSQYKNMTGKEWQNPGAPPRQVVTNKSKAPAAAKPSPAKADKPLPSQTNVKKQTRLGMEAKKEEDLADWYSQVITKGELIEYYDVSGCYILRPWSFAIWDAIRDYLDKEIKKLGVSNCYFPIFVSKSVLEKEKTHIADFSPEVAWVTKSGDTDLAEPIAIRPTSETVMYPAYAKWLQSYRDLPIKLNQWNNVVRWEFKHPQPFLRTREFLWQEGHTAFATAEEAQEEVYKALDMYENVYTNLLAIPVIKGRKTEKEKFAGGNFTTTVEAFISASGRAIQGATSHFLGQNFSKIFEIVYDDPDTQEKKYVYQNSWGITTRTIGVMIMVHADNQGLVLPPRVAQYQVVIVPCGITVSLSEQDKTSLINSCKEIETTLSTAGIRVYGDYRDNYSPGWKFNHWELKGVPIRLELGPKDIANERVMLIRRDTGDKTSAQTKDVVHQVKTLLQNIHDSLLKKATVDLESHIVKTSNWSEFIKKLDDKCILLSPFCGDIPCEDRIKQDSSRDDNVEVGAPSMGAKSLCIPFNQPQKIKPDDKCIHPACTNKPTAYTLFGRSY